MVVSMDRWCDKIAIVTGASAGIGAKITEELVKYGLNVVGLARRVEKIEEQSKKLTGQKGKLYALKADVSQETDILNAFKWVKDNLGPIHILINNAGIMQDTNLIEGDTEKWKKVIDLNITGLCVATREAVKDMRANNTDGHIIHINSIAGHKIPDVPNMNVYPASKYAVTALTETLRLELNRFNTKIKITSISPGLVDTEIIQTNNFKSDSNMAELFKSLPALKSEDVTDAVNYALSTPPHVQIHELIIKPVNEPV